MEIEDHYGLLLGIHSPWEISSVDLKMEKQQVDIVIEYSDVSGPCPECGAICPKHDDRKERTWRHLDTMQFSTYLHCQLPRVRCETHGAKTVKAPWAGKNSRFTLLFESFAIRVLTAARSVEEARKLLGLNWHQVEAIKARAVQRGLDRRKATAIPYIGIDEKQFRSGHHYISSLVDLDKGRVLDVVENRTEAACKTLIEQGDDRLKGSRYLWMTNEENQSEDAADRFATLKHTDLKVARAWAIKELFRNFWSYTYAGCAKRFYDQWYSWAIRSRLEPIKAKARMIKSHLPNMLTYFKHPISNAVAEGLNSKIQTVKSNARGYRSFDGFRNSILFYCGGLDMAL